ncbi:BTAD domain-containing putative transcriptional regulator [Nocardioides sp. BYT-33-1]|uniref:AfsR/SARP family transcriptional regulator n=1 Tax=Nocardioides sp. BYT-33-1 TaxID=3416952 RepID=UPI003F52ABD2
MSDDPLLRLLGAVSVRQPGGAAVAPARLDRLVLAHLALAEGRAVPATDLIDALWGPEAPAHARNALQVKVSRLRRHLGPRGHALQHDQGSYRLALARDEVDVGLFETLAREAADAAAAGRPEEAGAVAARALALWHGPPPAELGEHPRLVAARARLTEQRASLLELSAEAALAAEAPAPSPVDGLRALLAEDPLRSRARLLLMRALDRGGRRAEALAVYDVGRRVLAEQTGLAPPAELQEEFTRLLSAERRAARRSLDVPRAPAVPAGAMDAARWLAREGAVGAAVELALRGAWWWWLAGRRSEGRDLFEELVGIAPGGADRPAVLGATAWLGVFDAVASDAAQAIAAGEAALREALELGWRRPESLAAVLLAERLLQRGQPRRGTWLLDAARASLGRLGDGWGLALVGLVEAKAALQRGAVARATAGGRAARRAFEELDDPAGRMMAMDLLGYCSEIVGDLDDARRTHERALALARAIEAPEWQATQLTRLGSVQALAGSEQSLGTLRAAVRVARSIDSAAGVALAENGLGLAHGLVGEHDRAAQIHAATLTWYERQGSGAGVSYTAGRLAHELAAAGSPDAAALATRSVDLARATGDPRAVAHALEAVAVSHDDAPARARALGESHALRRRTGSPLPRVLAASLGPVRRRLAEELGDDLDVRLREGARQVSPQPR